jgi:hypothetical protein
VKLIAYQNGDRRVMCRVLENIALPFVDLEEFWADPQQGLVAAAQARSEGEPIASLVQVPPLPGTARVLQGVEQQRPRTLVGIQSGCPARADSATSASGRLGRRGIPGARPKMRLMQAGK